MSAANGMGIGRRLLLVAALIHGAACQCSPGVYKHLTSCLRCSTGQFSTAINSATCDACGPGQFASATGSTACAACSPGKYARFSGLSACPACPSGTGSEAGATECMSCIPGVNATSDNTTTAVPMNITTTVNTTNTTCRTAALKPCVSCPVACTACVPGKYNDGAAPKCASCAPGTYSAAVQAVSSMTCSLCEPGTSTRPTDTGMTSCTQCEALNQTVPLNAVADSSAGDPLVCGWSCEPGYTLLNVSAAGFNDSAYVATGYTASQAVRLFYAQHNYCCNPTLTSIGPGLYLKGCNRTYDGDAAACPPVANGNYFFTGVKVDHCADWVCEEGYYSNGTMCLKQRACDPGFTYRRDAAGVIARMAFGAFECVPCSVCAAGATLLRACNGSVDTRCAMCPSTHFSVSGGPCIAAPPLGSIGVVVRLTALPPFQGRPSVYWDGTPIQWGGVNFATGFFMNAYTPCQPPGPLPDLQGRRRPVLPPGYGDCRVCFAKVQIPVQAVERDGRLVPGARHGPVHAVRVRPHVRRRSVLQHGRVRPDLGPPVHGVPRRAAGQCAGLGQSGAYSNRLSTVRRGVPEWVHSHGQLHLHLLSKPPRKLKGHGGVQLGVQPGLPAGGQPLRAMHE